MVMIEFLSTILLNCRFVDRTIRTIFLIKTFTCELDVTCGVTFSSQVNTKKDPMKKITAICFIACALTTNNNMFGMLRSIIHRPNTQQLSKRMISKKSGAWPDVPYHRNYIYDEGAGTEQLNRILKENTALTRSIHQQNEIIKRLIELNKIKKQMKPYLVPHTEVKSSKEEIFQLARQFNELEKSVRP
jgi:hypothetical protein